MRHYVHLGTDSLADGLSRLADVQVSLPDPSAATG